MWDWLSREDALIVSRNARTMHHRAASAWSAHPNERPPRHKCRSGDRYREVKHRAKDCGLDFSAKACPPSSPDAIIWKPCIIVPPKIAAAATRLVAPATIPAATAISTFRRNGRDGIPDGMIRLFGRSVARHFFRSSRDRRKIAPRSISRRAKAAMLPPPSRASIRLLR